ncbi:MAG: hypothetical protein J07AB43_01070 [Candidatus Nanosalina sp. J07AB43]|jgi:hypothetical protein|nr:MAG: hypothetical protein J07AB43_01070 [Candidatus Nanosalina sp. J07AB43]
MKTVICADTIVGVLLIAGVLAFVFPLWPALAVAFEAGLLVGVFLHSAHSSHTPDLADVIEKYSPDKDQDQSETMISDGGKELSEDK